MTNPIPVEERRWREILRSLGFWVVLAYFLLAAVVVVLYFVNGARRRDEALHRGEVVAAARARVQQCLSSIPIGEKVNAFVHAVRVFHEASVANAQATLDETPKSDPHYATRKMNLSRLESTVPPVRQLTFHVPTKEECLALGDTVYGRVAPTVPGEEKPKEKKR